MTERIPLQVLALIPARCGSKSIPDKNIRLAGGKPLLAWSIEHALASRRVTRTIVSTDSPHYAKIAREHGAETPFLRPEPHARDHSTDLEVFEHALAWLETNEGYRPDLCVHLRPTCPVRNPATVDGMVELLASRNDLDSVRTIAEVVHPPFKMWYRDEEGMLSPIASVSGVEEPWNEPRQSLPATYIQTANVDVVRARVIRAHRSMSGRRIYGYLESAFNDIDTMDEFHRVSRLLMQEAAGTAPVRAGPVGDGHRVFCFDIDGVIATLTPGNDYRQSQPRAGVVQAIQRLHQAGHRIILFTARGTMTGINWREVTEQQMQQWGVPYHELRFGKPAADHYIDDRMLSLAELDDFARQVDPARG